jgi:hypothetical protein
MERGTRYEVQARSVSDLFSSTSSTEYRLRYGDLPYLPINANTTDWDVVYSTDIFGKDSFDYITTKDIAYTNKETIGARTFLYLLFDMNTLNMLVLLKVTSGIEPTVRFHLLSVRLSVPFPAHQSGRETNNPVLDCRG